MQQCIASKVKLYRYRHSDAEEERNYSFFSFLTSALDGCEWPVSRPGRALPPEIDPRYPLGKRLGDLQSWSVQKTKEKSFASARDRTSFVQYVVRQYEMYLSS
jgi:hypothetical protein